MKLYAIVGSPNSRKVLSVVHHLGLDIEVEYLDLFQGQHKTPEYLAINPNGMVPALVDGDLKLWESNAIIQYLADKAGDESLFPSEPKQRANVVRWLCWELAHFNHAFGTLAFEAIAKPGFMNQPSNEAVMSWAQDNLARFAPVLEKQLEQQPEGHDYVTGKFVTLADYAMIHVDFFKDSVPFDWTPFPNTNAYFDRMRQNPHWLATAPVDNDAIGKSA